MGLNDLMTEIKQDPNSFQGDEAVENKVLNQVLSLVEDKISEVKNQAVKWCVHYSSMCSFIPSFGHSYIRMNEWMNGYEATGYMLMLLNLSTSVVWAS
jgi:hypothetical protein